MQDAPLKLHWWKGVPNFGDALSPLVVAHVSGREVVHAGPRGAELWAIGSLMHVARQNRDAFRRRPVLWGTGQLGHVPRDVVAHVDIALTRGPIGAALLGLASTRFGDPGLLVAEALGPGPARQDVIGVVPHHTQMDDPALHAALAQDARLTLVDVHGDCAAVCHKIASCAHVVSASLHGLIVADAFGVPSTWMQPGAQSHFKYYDYAASIGRVLPPPLAVEDLSSGMSRLAQPAKLPYQDGITAAKDALCESFPEELRGSRELEGLG